jgi:hypothetical protein
MFWSKPKTISFAEAREVLVAVLRDVRCDGWSERVATASAASFQSLLGGMGSFSDLVICRQNHHNVSTDREPLANELVSCLTSVCYSSSKVRALALTADSAIACCGTFSLVLTGWRCLTCGHAQVTSRGLRSLIAAIEVREALRNGVAKRTPAESLLALWRSPEDTKILRLFIERAESSGIEYSESEEWMRPCPACGSDNTCVYRWRDDGARFVSAADNLPLSK